MAQSVYSAPTRPIRLTSSGPGSSKGVTSSGRALRRIERSVPMSSRLSRRRFLRTSAGAAAGLSLAVLDRAPAHAQKRELTLLTFNHFVPASDDELRRQGEVFAKQAGVTVRV